MGAADDIMDDYNGALRAGDHGPTTPQAGSHQLNREIRSRERAALDYAIAWMTQVMHGCDDRETAAGALARIRVLVPEAFER